MFEFFIALFGGAFWGGKYIKERSAINSSHKAYESSMIMRETRKAEFESKVIDRELEADLEEFIYDTGNYDIVWKEVLEAFNEMPWKAEEDKFICLTPQAVEIAFGKGTFTKKQREEIAANHRKQALRIMMANRGKLMQNDAQFGIQTSGYGAPTVRQAEQLNRGTANFILWINEKLKEHGIDERVLLLKDWGNYEWYEVTETNKAIGGTYYWYPSVLVTIDKVNQ